MWSLFCSDIEMKRGLKLHTASWSSADCVVEKVKCAEETDSDWVLPWVRRWEAFEKNGPSLLLFLLLDLLKQPGLGNQSR